MSSSPTGTNRPAAPLSPPSPQSESLRKHTLPQAIKSVANQPQTPTSPSSMSTSSHRHASPQTSSNAATSHSLTNNSSPSAVPMSAQNSQQPFANTMNAFPTPASIVAAPPPTSRGEEPMSRSLSTSTNDGLLPAVLSATKRAREDDSESEGSEKRRKTNHDRIGHTKTDEAMDLTDDPPQESSTLPSSSLSSRGLGKDWMRESVGEPYLLCKEPYATLRPHPSDDLISQYGLSRLALTVARTLPNGERNKLRKTYKGKIIAANLNGRDKETKHPDGEPGSLPELMAWPDEEWSIQKASGIHVDRGMPDSTFAKLSRAFDMEPGPMPDFEDSVLGLNDDPPLPAANSTATTQFSRQTSSQQQAKATSNEPARLRRTGAKRSYADGSFEGYGEGFVDDEMDRDGGNGGGGGGGNESAGSGAEDGRGGRRGPPGLHKKKRRRTEYGNPSNSTTSPGLGDRSGSYGLGVGIGGGGSAGITVHR